MMKLTIPKQELYDEINNLFIPCEECTLILEHSLESISKWEANWKKPFLVEGEKTHEETIDYVKCMTLNVNVSDNIYYCLTKSDLNIINDYIYDVKTATVFSDDKNKQTSSSTYLTSELIYYLMSAYGIPFTCDKWHLSRLLTLIKICQIKNEEPKKQSKKDIAARNSALNRKRREQMRSKG